MPNSRPAVSAATDPAGHEEFLIDVLAGLSRAHKSIPGKYLWDETGSDLFDRICLTSDYYLTRCETALLEETAGEIAAFVGDDASLVEYGSGASRKVRILLDAMTRPLRYVAIDISAEYLEKATRRIAAEYPSLDVLPIVADYSLPIDLRGHMGSGSVLGFFPGSTIGNFDRDGVVAFLERARTTLDGGWFLVGHDTNRDPDSLQRAYGMADGLMPALHLNLLSHVNRVLGADFVASEFRHEIQIKPDPFRVEAGLVARRGTSCRVGGRSFTFAEGERLHTDTSYKMDVETFKQFAFSAGWRTHCSWTGPDERYALHLLACSD